MSKAWSEDQLMTRVGLLEEHLRAENAHDLEAIMETFGQGAIMILNGYTFEDHKGIRSLHEEFGFNDNGGFSDLRIEVKQRHIASDAIVLEQTLSGRHTGTWQGYPATGRSFKVAVCTVYTFDEEGKLAGENAYFDRAFLLKQLGALA
jgi:steroid delta-isomerase-like uncharacterized protein